MNVAEILKALQNKEITQEDAELLLSQPQKKGKAKAEFGLEVSPKGAVRVKGMRQRWGGLVLYVNEMRLILDNKDKIEAFMEANKDKLSLAPKAKGEEEAPAEGELQKVA